MTMVPAAAHHHHQQTLSSTQQQEQHHLYGGGYGGCGADYYNNAAPDDEESFGSLMSQVEEGGGGGYDHQYNNYRNANNSTITDHHHQSAANYVLGGSNSDLILVNDPMAEDESRTNSLNTEAAELGAEAAEAGSTSKAHGADEDERDDQRWLQLGIGGNTATSAGTQATERRNLSQLRGSSSASGLIELDLLSENMTSSRQLQTLQQARSPMLPMFHVPDHHHHHHHQIRVPNFGTNLMSTTSSNLYFQHPGIGMGMGMGMNSSLSSSFPQQQQHHHQEVNWGFRPLIPACNNNNNIIIGNNSASTTSSSSSFIQLGPSSSSSSSYFARPFQFSHYHHQYHGGAGAAGPGLDFRVVDPPRRPQSGIWFLLQASRNQEKEPFLPQIPKSYLRIKDGRMTVRLIKKYLVNKLRLDSESEVEITCRGQQLVPFLTLQHVRDNIWSLRDAAAAADHLALLPLPDSTDDHVMVLHYARTSSSSTTA